MVASDARASPLSLFDINVPGAGTAQVPLAAVTRLARAHASMWIRHSEQFPAITLSFDTRPGVSIGEAVAAVRQAAVEARIPDDIVAEFRGEAEAASKSRAQQLLLVLAAVITIYIALGILYESTLHPFTILTTLPSALIGALLALWVTGTELTLISMIGCILVIGIVMKNAIIMVDFALAAQRRGAVTARDAIRSAALVRARPILMTTFVAGFGAVPIALGTGPGHELRQPLGIVIIGGLMVSQLFTLFTTPVVYLLMERLRSRRPA
jgi:multidrug efflux pump subunit AcrB